jgi:hypothetical protein
MIDPLSFFVILHEIFGKTKFKKDTIVDRMMMKYDSFRLT